MLCLRFPEETLKFKYNPAPISEYDALNNLTAMKKLLNKLGLQLHLNIHSVLNSKNNFDLAKWFKALVDREISVDNPGNFDNKSQKMSRDSSTVNRMTIESNFSSAKTPKNRPEEMQNFRKHL